MQIRFGKLAKNGDIDVTVTINDVEHTIEAFVFEGKIELVSIRSIDPTGNQRETLTNQINAAYNQQNQKKSEARNRRIASKEINHWWNAMSETDKKRLIMPLRDKLISIVDALLERNPNDIKRRHYESLIRRSQLGVLTVSSKLAAPKLNKLPRYDVADDKLRGSHYAFIALAEVCYPSLRSTKAAHVEL